jgi:hypothetical protein
VGSLFEGLWPLAVIGQMRTTAEARKISRRPAGIETMLCIHYLNPTVGSYRALYQGAFVMLRHTLSISVSFLSGVTLAGPPDCNVVLQYAKITEKAFTSSVSVRNFYSAFCSTKTTSKQQAQQRAQSFGLDYEGFGINLGNDTSDAEVAKAFEKICSEIDTHSYDKSDFWREVERIDAGVVNAYQQCLRVPGIRGSFAIESELREQIIFEIVNVAGENGRDLNITKNFTVNPAAAVSKTDPCLDGLAARTRLYQNTPTSSACVLRSDFTGRTITVSGGINGVSKTWTLILPEVKKSPVATPGQPPIAVTPPVPKPRPPELVLVRGNNFTWPEQMGSWLKIGQPVVSQIAGRVATEAFSLYIDDPSDTFSPNASILATLTLQTTNHQRPAGPFGPARNAALQTLPIQHHTKTSFPLSFPPYGVDMRGTMPNVSDVATLVINAAKAENAGLQARTTGLPACTQSPVTATPVSPDAKIVVSTAGNAWPGSLSLCNIELRLCALPSHPLYNASNSCETIMPARKLLQR